MQSSILSILLCVASGKSSDPSPSDMHRYQHWTERTEQRMMGASRAQSLITVQPLHSEAQNRFTVALIMVNVSEGSSHCPLGYFPCGNLSTCLPQLLHCNGVDDCGNQADEENCGDNNGWPHLFDKYFGNPSNDLGTKSNVCLLGPVPAGCQCRDLELDCDGAHYKDVPFVSINVTMMSLQRNRMGKLNADMFFKYQNLQKLYLQHNRVRVVELHAFRGLYNLTRLYLSHNQISSLVPGVFQDLHKVEWLILENNKIQQVSSLTFTGLRSLILLVLLDNALMKLEDVCLEMPRLNWLDMEGNQLDSIENTTFSSCNMLTVLNISNNPIQDLQMDHFHQLHKLKSLSMEGMEIGNIHRKMFEPLKNLTHIYFKKFQYCGYAPHVRSCKPNTDGISSFEDLLANIVLRVFVWVVSATTCFGNIFVICMRSYIRSENKLHAMCIISLCCADGLMGVYLFVIGAYDLKFRGEYNRHAQAWMDSVPCQVVGSLAMLSTEVSVLLLTYLTMEKYICIVYPFRYLTPGRQRTVSILVVIWILGFIIAFLPLVWKEVFRNFYGTNGVCFPLHSEQPETVGAQIYSIVIFLGLNLVAFLVILLSYGSMFYNIQRTETQTTKYSNHIKKEVTIAKRFFSIVITDSLCWIPIFILKILSLMDVEIPGTISSWVVIFILPINSALNPILYTLTTRPFKETLLQVWTNYRQRRPLLSSHAAHPPFFTWQEMWPLQENSQHLTSPEYLAHPSEMSCTSGTSQLLPPDKNNRT
ncbi:relaxin receptor 1 isoform X4 [Hoplias malabaricus]|uniref:relaxin receptor 1 isoform X4 n=1 Tax=Hoplias malabaricus TaxID=27720 RepID=UPI003462DC78